MKPGWDDSMKSLYIIKWYKEGRMNAIVSVRLQRILCGFYFCWPLIKIPIIWHQPASIPVQANDTIQIGNFNSTSFIPISINYILVFWLWLWISINIQRNFHIFGYFSYTKLLELLLLLPWMNSEYSQEKC